MNIRRALILGIAKSYSVRELSPFILSLKKSGYRGDVCLFIDRLEPEALEFLHSHGVRLQLFPNRYFIQGRRYLLRWLLACIPGRMRYAARFHMSRYYLPLVDARWACYLEFLYTTRGLYSHVMFTDVKDVIFQRDPFDFEWKGSFCSFYEAPGLFISPGTPTHQWVKTAYGGKVAREFEDKRVINAGISFAEFDAAIEYLRLLCSELVRINARGLVDQAVHNRLLYRRRLTSCHIYDFDESPVLHLMALPPEKLNLKDGLVLNGSGRVANVLHQYIVHEKALAPVLDPLTLPV